MLDLFLSLAATTAQVQILAQATTVYLPISTTQSSRKDCVTYTATNATGRSVSEVYVNYTTTNATGRSVSNVYVNYIATNATGRSVSSVNREDGSTKYPLSSFLIDGILKSGDKVSFDICDGGSFINVESRQ